MSCDGRSAFRERQVYDQVSDERLGSVLHNIDTNELRESGSMDKISLRGLVGKNILIRYG